MCGRILEYMDGWMIEEDSAQHAEEASISPGRGGKQDQPDHPEACPGPVSTLALLGKHPRTPRKGHATVCGSGRPSLDGEDTTTLQSV